MFSHRLVVDNCAWVTEVEQNHDQEHESRIENVDENLSRQKIPAISLAIFNDTEDGSDHDQGAGNVEDHQVLLPWYGNGRVSATVGSGDAVVEDGGGENEEAEEDNLDCETTCDDVVAGFRTSLCLCCSKHSTTRRLHKERKHIASYEDLGEPFSTNRRVLFSVRQEDDSAQDHVNRSSEKSGGQENQQALHNIWSKSPFRIVLLTVKCSSNVSYGFEQSANHEWNEIPCFSCKQLEYVTNR